VVPVDVINRGMRNVNFRRLLVWMSIGADARYGLWSVLGARMGFMKNFEAAFDPAMISRFDWFPSLWHETGQSVAARKGDADADLCEALERTVASLGKDIREQCGLLFLSEWSADRSRKFKESMTMRRPRRGVFDVEQDL
jgi:hypothetical protein